MAGALVDIVVRWQREGRIDGWGLLWLDGQVKCLDGYLRRLRADPQHAAFIVVPRPAPPRDRALPGDRPVLSDRGYRDLRVSDVRPGGLFPAGHRAGGRGDRRAIRRRRRQPAAGALLRDDRHLGPRDSGARRASQELLPSPISDNVREPVPFFSETTSRSA